MRIGIVEILYPSRVMRPDDFLGRFIATKQYASIMPQAVSVWCQEAGHEVFYGTWYGHGNPDATVPHDLDFLFVSSSTPNSHVGYMLAKLHRRRGATTVLGGSHARAFPVDALRYFDHVVLDCDRQLIREILRGEHAPGTVINSPRPLKELPLLEQRIPEVKKSAFWLGRYRYPSTAIPMLSSVGCPYSCDFCSDWNSTYNMLPDQLEADLRYAARNLPGMRLIFHDPNFGVQFDRTLEIIERVENMNPYWIESSMAILNKPDRLERLAASNCRFVAPGVESWKGYGNKAGVGSMAGREKLETVVGQLRAIYDQIPGMQYNVMFGLDVDEGREPVELTMELIRECAFGYPAVNIPVPFGGTPLFNSYMKQDRVLKTMPFMFYYWPYAALRPVNYDPVTYYEHLIEIFRLSSSTRMLLKRLKETKKPALKTIQALRTYSQRRGVRQLQEIHQALTTDRQVRSYHDGSSKQLPDFYKAQARKILGQFEQLFPEGDWTPDLSQHDVRAAPRLAAVRLPGGSSDDQDATLK